MVSATRASDPLVAGAGASHGKLPCEGRSGSLDAALAAPSASMSSVECPVFAAGSTGAATGADQAAAGGGAFHGGGAAAGCTGGAAGSEAAGADHEGAAG